MQPTSVPSNVSYVGLSYPKRCSRNHEQQVTGLLQTTGPWVLITCKRSPSLWAELMALCLETLYCWLPAELFVSYRDPALDANL